MVFRLACVICSEVLQLSAERSCKCIAFLEIMTLTVYVDFIGCPRGVHRRARPALDIHGTLSICINLPDKN